MAFHFLIDYYWTNTRAVVRADSLYDEVFMRILIVDDHKAMIEGVKLILALENDMEVVGCAFDGDQAVCIAGEKVPDVILMDIGMPNRNGIEATAIILANSPEIKILGMSIQNDRQTVEAIFRAGATGYLTKDSAAENLVDAIRCVMTGKRFLPVELEYLRPEVTNIN